MRTNAIDLYGSLRPMSYHRAGQQLSSFIASGKGMPILSSVNSPKDRFSPFKHEFMRRNVRRIIVSSLLYFRDYVVSLARLSIRHLSLSSRTCLEMRCACNCRGLGRERVSNIVAVAAAIDHNEELLRTLLSSLRCHRLRRVSRRSKSHLFFHRGERRQ